MTTKWKNLKWWTEPKWEGGSESGRAVAYALSAAVDQVQDKDRQRLETALRHARLYGGGDLRGLTAGEYHEFRDPTRITMNVIRSVIDTLMARVTKNKPVPTFITEFGDPSRQRRAKRLTRFTEGAFYQMGVEDESPMAWRDGAIMGTGAYKVYSENGDIKGERVFPWELFVDHVDACYGAPRCLYQVKLVDRGVLAELYPDQADAIERANVADSNTIALNRDTLAEQLRVVEAWRLPSTDDADDGRHVIAIEGQPLLDEDWTRPRFPVAIYRYARRQAGYWGQGIAEMLQGRQYEINVLLQKIQEGYSLHARPIMLIPRGSKIYKGHVTDELDTMLEYTGDIRPELAVWPVFPPEVYEHLQYLVASAYEEIGVSQLAATSKKPSGLDAGVALREYDDIGSERFLPVGRDYEAFRMEIAELVLDEAGEIPGYSVKVADDREMLTLDFADVKLERDAFVMKMFPTSSLPRDPWGKLQFIQELIAAGQIEPEEQGRLLDMPDLAAYKAQKFAPYDVVDRALETIEEDGEYVTPEPEMPLPWAMKRAANRYNLGKLQGLEEERLDLLMQFKDDCEALIQKATAPQAAPAAAPGPAPQPQPQQPYGELAPAVPPAPETLQ